MIISITGPSGVGKTTLLHNLLQTVPEARPLISYTTRPPRPSDEPGEYQYVSREEFETMAQGGAFLWEANTTSNRYGTKKADIDTALRGGIYIPILVVDAAQQLNAYAAATPGAVTFLYLHLNDEEELRKRFAERGEQKREMEARLAQCRDWNAQAKRSGVPFVFLQAAQTREEILRAALAVIKK